MRKLVVSIISLVLFLNLGLGSFIPVNAVENNKIKLTDEDLAFITENFEMYGVDETIQKELINKLENGQVWDSMNPDMEAYAEFVKTTEDGNMYVYPDGSVVVTSEGDSRLRVGYIWRTIIHTSNSYYTDATAIIKHNNIVSRHQYNIRYDITQSNRKPNIKKADLIEAYGVGIHSVYFKYYTGTGGYVKLQYNVASALNKRCEEETRPYGTGFRILSNN